MIDIVTEFSSVDDNWHYPALLEDVRSGVEAMPGAHLLAGNHDDCWTVETLDVGNGLIRFNWSSPPGSTRTHLPSRRPAETDPERGSDLEMFLFEVTPGRPCCSLRLVIHDHSRSTAECQLDRRDPYADAPREIDEAIDYAAVETGGQAMGIPCELADPRHQPFDGPLNKLRLNLEERLVRLYLKDG